MRRFRECILELTRASCELGFSGGNEISEQSSTTSSFSSTPHLSPPHTGVALLAVLRIRAHAADTVRARRVWRDGAGQQKWRRSRGRCWRRSDDGDDSDGNSRQCCRRRCSLAHGRRLRSRLLRRARQVSWSFALAQGEGFSEGVAKSYDRRPFSIVEAHRKVFCLCLCLFFSPIAPRCLLPLPSLPTHRFRSHRSKRCILSCLD